MLFRSLAALGGGAGAAVRPEAQARAEHAGLGGGLASPPLPPAEPGPWSDTILRSIAGRQPPFSFSSSASAACSLLLLLLGTYSLHQQEYLSLRLSPTHALCKEEWPGERDEGGGVMKRGAEGG